MAFMQITVLPLGTGSPSVGNYIADIERFLLDKGVEHTLHDMGTVIIGSTTELLQLAEEIHRLPFARGAQRVVTNITLDERLDLERNLGDKKLAVVRRLEKKEVP